MLYYLYQRFMMGTLNFRLICIEFVVKTHAALLQHGNLGLHFIHFGLLILGILHVYNQLLHQI